MTGYILLPRLEPAAAADIRRRLVGSDTIEVKFDESRFADALVAPKVFASTGGRRITDGELMELREQCEKTVGSDGCAFSASFTQSFDISLGRLFSSFGQSSISELGRPQVWDFLTLVLLPDLAMHRIAAGRDANAVGNSASSRLTGGDRRHVFQRLWKRWKVFGADWVESRMLTEDDYVAMLERNLTLAQSRVARRAANEIIRSRLTGTARREYARVLMRNLVALSGVVHVGEDDPSHLDEVFSYVREQTITMI